MATTNLLFQDGMVQSHFFQLQDTLLPAKTEGSMSFADTEKKSMKAYMRQHA
jgi:hypothetical protein